GAPCPRRAEQERAHDGQRVRRAELGHTGNDRRHLERDEDGAVERRADRRQHDHPRVAPHAEQLSRHSGGAYVRRTPPLQPGGSGSSVVVDCPLAFHYGGRMRRVCRALLVVALCAACGTKKPTLPSDQLWAEGNQAMQDEAWQLATERYKALLEQ